MLSAKLLASVVSGLSKPGKKNKDRLTRAITRFRSRRLAARVQALDGDVTWVRAMGRAERIVAALEAVAP